MSTSWLTCGKLSFSLSERREKGTVAVEHVGEGGGSALFASPPNVGWW